MVGGHDGGSSRKSAEMYDRSAGEWRALPEMSMAREACAAVCIDGNVYAVGGHDGATKHASVERYDPVANEWRMLPNMCMGAPRISFAAAVGEMGHG